MIVVSAAKPLHQNYQTKHSSIALYVPMEYQPAIDNCTRSIVFQVDKTSLDLAK